LEVDLDTAFPENSNQFLYQVSAASQMVGNVRLLLVDTTGNSVILAKPPMKILQNLKLKASGETTQMITALKFNRRLKFGCLLHTQKHQTVASQRGALF